VTTVIADLVFDQLPEAAVLCAPAAPVPAEWVQAMLRMHWGLDGALEALSGERDSNFLLTMASIAAGAPVRRLLKVSHPAEPIAVTDFQTQALLHLARHAPELPVQRLWPARDGAVAVSASAPDGQPRVLRLLSYLEGLPMPQAPRSAAQRASVAGLLARLDRALASLQHPAANLALPWDIQRAHQVRSLVDAMADPVRRALAQGALQLFESTALPYLGALPRQPTHNDFNIYNLLVDPAQPEQVSGILDFGDMLAAPHRRPGGGRGLPGRRRRRRARHGDRVRRRLPCRNAAVRRRTRPAVATGASQAGDGGGDHRLARRPPAASRRLPAAKQRHFLGPAAGLRCDPIATGPRGPANRLRLLSPYKNPHDPTHR
jgi:Ser/Thr protein kinase RdoA (MazF antagonist)